MPAVSSIMCTIGQESLGHYVGVRNGTLLRASHSVSLRIGLWHGDIGVCVAQTLTVLRQGCNPVPIGAGDGRRITCVASVTACSAPLARHPDPSLEIAAALTRGMLAEKLPMSLGHSLSVDGTCHSDATLHRLT